MSYKILAAPRSFGSASSKLWDVLNRAGCENRTGSAHRTWYHPRRGALRTLNTSSATSSAPCAR